MASGEVRAGIEYAVSGRRCADNLPSWASEAWNRRREPPASAIVHEDVACDIQKVRSVGFRQISSKQGRATRRWPTIYKDVWDHSRRHRCDANARWRATKNWASKYKKFVQYASDRYQANKGKRREGGPRHTKMSGFNGYVAWFPHANVRGHRIINYGGSSESVKMKASSSLTLHCTSNGVVSNPCSTRCAVTNQTRRGPRHCNSLPDRTSTRS
jgi:hypothetical protein